MSNRCRCDRRRHQAPEAPVTGLPHPDALKNALPSGRQGEIRDRSSEGQHYRMAGFNLIAAIVIYGNTVYLGETLRRRKLVSLTVEPELLAHISPLGWTHIPLTDECRWPKRQ